MPHAAQGRPSTRTVGTRYEILAWKHLRRAGLHLLERNYQARTGEIDLVCRDGDTFVFVEVRYRRGTTHGHPVETVNGDKQRRIIRTAQCYLRQRGLAGRVGCRFDIVGVVGAGRAATCHWIKDAFQWSLE